MATERIFVFDENLEKEIEKKSKKGWNWGILGSLWLTDKPEGEATLKDFKWGHEVLFTKTA